MSAKLTDERLEDLRDGEGFDAHQLEVESMAEELLVLRASQPSEETKATVTCLLEWWLMKRKTFNRGDSADVALAELERIWK